MALAILRYTGEDSGRLEFDVELGCNRFYSYAIGDGTVESARGLAVLAERTVASPLFGPIADSPLGRATLLIPVEQFDKDHRAVQIASFRTARMEGPAISDVIRVPLGGIRSGGDDAFPTIAFGSRSHMQVQTQPRPVAFRYRERGQLTSAMFLEGLLPLLTQALPMLNGLMGGPSPALAGASPAPPVPAGTDDVMGQLLRFIGQLAAAAKRGTAELPRATAVSLPPAAGVYSNAQFAPLLAMLPELMPLLKQVLTPETIKAVLDMVDPSKLMGAVTDSVKEVGKLGIEHQKQFQDWISSMNPGLEDASLDGLLASMSLDATTSLARGLADGPAGGPATSQEPAYRRVPSVTIDFTGVSPQLVRGRTRMCYRAGRELRFPLSVTTPKPIRDARLHLLLKDPATRLILARTRVDVPETSGGALTGVAGFAASATAALATGTEYLVCAYLTWRNGKKQVVGTSRTQLMTLVGPYIFDSVEDEGALIPLNDSTKHRDFWHKAWQGTFSPEYRSADWDCKYYVVLDPERLSNARMETVTRPGEREGTRQTGRLKTGFIASLAALNALVPQVSAYHSLTGDEMAALRDAEFVERFHVAARFKANLRGKSGASAALWVYPEIKMQRVTLQDTAQVNEAGHVTRLADHVVHFPMPALLHVIGARTTE